MIYFLFGSHVQKLESGFFSDWSRNNTYDSLCSDWLSCFYETSGQKETKCLRDANSEFSTALTTSLEDFIHISFKDA